MTHYNDEEEFNFREEDREGVLIGPIIACSILGLVIAMVVCIVTNAEEIDNFITNLLTK